jgi:hypothetical protein
MQFGYLRSQGEGLELSNDFISLMSCYAEALGEGPISYDI